MARVSAVIFVAALTAGCGSLTNNVQRNDIPVGVSPQVLADARHAATRLRELPRRTGEQPAGERADLRETLWAFEQTVIRKAVRLEQSDEWAGAQRLFDLALEVYPDSPILDSAEQQFLERRAVRETMLRAELAIHKGEQLLKDAEAYERLRKVKRAGLISWLGVNTYERQRRKTAEALHRFGDIALEQQDYFLARRCLWLANRLDGNAAIKAGLKRADREIAEMRRRIASRQRSVDEDEPLRLADTSPDMEASVATFHEALRNGQLQRARKRLQAMQRAYPDNDEVRRLSEQLKTRLQRHVAEAIERGKILYSEGKVEQALSVWRRARPLDPDNVELLSSISRAEKVLQNLRVLSAQQEDDQSS